MSKEIFFTYESIKSPGGYQGDIAFAAYFGYPIDAARQEFVYL